MLAPGMHPCCFSGTLTTGTPKGTLSKVGGVDCYVTKPPVWRDVKDSNGDAATRVPCVLIYPDVFGIQFLNTQLVADRIAEAGFLVVMVDIINGPAVDATAMEAMLTITRPDLTRPDSYKPSLWNSVVVRPWLVMKAVGCLLYHMPPFLLRQGTFPPKNRSMLSRMDSVTTELKSGALGPIGKLGAIGFCYGGPFAFMHAGLRFADPNTFQPLSTEEPDASKLVDAFVVAHTSIQVPEYFRAAQRPGLVLAADKDHSFPDQARAEAEALFPTLNVPFKMKFYPGTFHGFMNRGDPRDKVIQEAQEDGLRQIIEWFNTYLAA